MSHVVKNKRIIIVERRESKCTSSSRIFYHHHHLSGDAKEYCIITSLSPHGQPFYIFPLSPIINKPKGRITTFSELEEKWFRLLFLSFHCIRIEGKKEIYKSKYTKRNKYKELTLERKKDRPRDIKETKYTQSIV